MTQKLTSATYNRHFWQEWTGCFFSQETKPHGWFEHIFFILFWRGMLPEITAKQLARVAHETRNQHDFVWWMRDAQLDHNWLNVGILQKKGSWLGPIYIYIYIIYIDNYVPWLGSLTGDSKTFSFRGRVEQFHRVWALAQINLLKVVNLPSGKQLHVTWKTGGDHHFLRGTSSF